jgi:hypothetical protein
MLLAVATGTLCQQVLALLSQGLCLPPSIHLLAVAPPPKDTIIAAQLRVPPVTPMMRFLSLNVLCCLVLSQ